MRVRTETRERVVPKTIDGKTHDVTERFSVDVPVPPPDRDAQALIAVITLAAVIVAGAVVWSTVAIGGLLSMTSPPWIAYGIAAVFDAAWIGFMVLEWINRYDAVRARLPRRAGWAALCLSMTLIAAHGAVHGSLGVGLAGAAVSLVAKGFWAVVMKATGAELDPASAQWAAAERAEVHAEMATVAVRRQLARTRARIREEESALASGGSVAEVEWTTRGVPEERLHAALVESVRTGSAAPDPGGGSGRTDPGSGSAGSVKDAVRVLFESGTTDPAAIVRALPDANPETVRRHVRTVRTEGGYA
ncbi:protein transporter Sec31 [Streptomyces sp. NPDC002962]|uniref:protein transporter Sec31 n=1 Tax=Streptomyces sp. NPDC002962 TaxID=3364674 RepID=UPI0036CFA902